ncbi:hypothetical protein E2C01_039455 [Portunus trituberculatus]|uniref:Uncharacterized protein n=1 Tax=Portunus trituberculatus TaxID=210409 RepID=A0A5B7FKT6_PORTR|nr:hypothetical protein [Portunus trituberculatus]
MKGGWRQFTRVDIAFPYSETCLSYLSRGSPHPFLTPQPSALSSLESRITVSTPAASVASRRPSPSLADPRPSLPSLPHPFHCHPSPPSPTPPPPSRLLRLPPPPPPTPTATTTTTTFFF